MWHRSALLSACAHSPQIVHDAQGSLLSRVRAHACRAGVGAHPLLESIEATKALQNAGAALLRAKKYSTVVEATDIIAIQAGTTLLVVGDAYQHHRPATARAETGNSTAGPALSPPLNRR